MKKLITLVFLLFLINNFCFSQEIKLKNIEINKNSSFIFSQFVYENKKVADIFLTNLDHSFFFFSEDNRPDLFKKNILSTSINSLTQAKNIKAEFLMLANFSNVVTSSSFNLNYLLNSLEIMIFAPEYLKKSPILTPKKEANKFFIETTINSINFYGIMFFEHTVDQKIAKDIISKSLGKSKIIPLSNFSFKLIVLDKDNKPSYIYKTDKNVKSYSCLYLAGKQN